MNQMQCRLCLKRKTLLKKSHIIPDFMYKYLFDDIHRLHEVRVTESGELKDKIKQTGAYEGDILCLECDNKRIGNLETYASKVLYGGTAISLVNERNQNGMMSTLCKKIDYSKFKLFLLSVIWRASISSLPMFKALDLGDHEERIRTMILENFPGEQTDDPCLLMTYINQKQIPHQIIVEPSTLSEDGGFTCFLMIAGVLYIYFIGNQNIPPWAIHCIINKNGEMRVPHLPQHLAGKALNRLMGVNLFNESIA